MQLLTGLFFVTTLCWLTKGSQLSTPTEITDEDKAVLNETIAKYGPFKDYRAQNLPGPELEVDGDVTLHDNVFIGDVNLNYTLRLRTVFGNFSYNSRYENGEIINIDNVVQQPIIKGQFGEHFERESGGYYIRSIGYTIDERGYQEFFIDLTIATISDAGGEVVIAEGMLGAPPSEAGISSTVLITLSGGNNLG